MCPPRATDTSRRSRDSRAEVRRRGVTLVEFLAVSAILLMMAGTLATLAIGVQASSDYQYRQGMSLQHGQVALQRITRALNDAHANDQFPGFLVFEERIGGESYPDTLVVWYCEGSPASPQGLPVMNELVMFCCNPESPGELWEITAPNDNRSAPHPSKTSEWRSELSYFKKAGDVKRVVLTNLMRTSGASDEAIAVSARRGVLRFESTLRPSAEEWQQFLDGKRSWESLPWVQGIHSSQAGLRQSWCRIEFQLRPGESTDDSRDAAIPFFGSGSALYELRKP